MSGAAAAAVAIVVGSQAPGWAAGALLHPMKSVGDRTSPPRCQAEIFTGAGVKLPGWHCRAVGTSRALVVYLHGVADNHTSARGVIAHLLQRGFDVVAYDSRAHGESGGDSCTYGFYEKDDLRAVIDGVGAERVVLIGASLGAAVALQEAGRDPRVAAVVAAETFSDLRTIARERAPAVLPVWVVRRAFLIAEERGAFQIDGVSPVDSARSITAPVLLVHGAADRETTPDHSRRVFDALGGAKRLRIVEGAGHNQSLRAEVWNEIDRWLDDVLDVSTPRKHL